MAGVGHLNDDRINHWQVQAGGHPVVEEAGVQHPALVVHEVFLVQRPADTLHHAALDLALDVAGVYGPPGVLQSGVAKNSHLARVGVYLHVHDVQPEGVAHAAGVDRCPAHDGAAGAVEPGRQGLEGDAQLRVLPVGQDALVVFHILRRHVPDTGGPFDHLLLDVLGGVVAGGAHLEGDAAATGAGAVADGIGVHHRRLDRLHRDAQHLGNLHRHGGPRAADVRRTLDEADGAVRVHAGDGAGRAGAVEPRAGGHAATPVRAGERLRQVRVLLRRLQGFHESNLAEDRAGGLAAALLGRVAQPELHRVHAQLLADFVDDRLGGKGCGGRTRGAVGRRLLGVDHHVDALDEAVGHFVGGQHGAAARRHGRAGEGARLVYQRAVGGGQLPFTGRAQLDPDVAGRGRPGALEHFAPRHGNLHWLSALAGEGRDHRLQVAAALALAPEPAANLHGDDFDAGHGDAQDGGGVVAQGEVALAAGPDGN